MTDAKDASAAAKDAPDLRKIEKDLRAEGDGGPKKAAREAVKAMTGTWEHLPVFIRSAIREDVGRIIVSGKGKADVIAAGYSELTAERALRDLGHRG
jgi:hypothetical protein